MIILFIAVGSVSAADLDDNISDNSVSEILNDNNQNTSSNLAYGLDSNESNDSCQNSLSVSVSNNSSDNISNLKSLDSSVTSNLTVVSTTNTVKYVTIANILTASVNVKAYIYSKKTIPNTVTVGSYTVSSAQYSYLAAMAIKYLKAGKKTSTKIKIIDVALKSTTLTVNCKLSKAYYVKLASNVASYCSSNHVTPAYATINSKKIDYRSYVYGFAKILAYYKSNKVLPNTCLFESGVYTKYVTISNILVSSKNVKTFVLSKEAIPATVTVGSFTVSSAQYSYLAAMAIKYLKAGKTVSTKIAIISVSLKTVNYTVNCKLSKAYYVKLASNVASYCSSNHVTPAYATMNSKKIDYRSYTYGFAKILAYYKSNKVLPNTCLFESAPFEVTQSASPEVTQDIYLADILNAANTVNTHVYTNYGIPKNVTINGVTYNMTSFLYMMVSAIGDISNNKLSSKYVVKNLSVDKDLNGDWVITTVSKNNYLTVASNILNFIDKNSRIPNYATLPSSGEKVNYNLYTATFANILTYYKVHKVLPSTQLFNNSLFESYYIDSSLLKNKNKNLTFYLTSDSIVNNQSDNAMLNSIAKTLKNLGYKVVIVGVGPNKMNEALTSGCNNSNSVLLCCFGAVDVGCIEEWTGELGKSFCRLANGASVLSVFYLDPYGCAANLHDPIDIAWDADYGRSLEDAADYMEDNGISYIQTGTVSEVCNILKSTLG